MQICLFCWISCFRTTVTTIRCDLSLRRNRFALPEAVVGRFSGINRRVYHRFYFANDVKWTHRSGPKTTNHATGFGGQSCQGFAELRRPSCRRIAISNVRWSLSVRCSESEVVAEVIFSKFEVQIQATGLSQGSTGFYACVRWHKIKVACTSGRCAYKYTVSHHKSAHGVCQWYIDQVRATAATAIIRSDGSIRRICARLVSIRGRVVCPKFSIERCRVSATKYLTSLSLGYWINWRWTIV